jgi:hypothetical protein
VACGFAWPQLAANGNQDTWVIKLDSNGCDTIGRCPIVNGINEISVGNNSVRVYPNPSKGVFNFKFTSQSEFVENKCTVEVYNMLGEKVYSNKFFNSQFSINIGNEPQGIYLYRVITNKGEVMGSGKLIIE